MNDAPLVRMTTRALVLSLVLSSAACSSPEPNAVALVVAYRGPTGKYVPCLVLSHAQHSRAAVALGEKLDCRAFVAIIGTTSDPKFFREVDEHAGTSGRGESRSILFVTLDPAGQRKDREFSVPEGVSKVRGLAEYFPEVRDRIETEFARRLSETTPGALMTLSGLQRSYSVNGSVTFTVENKSSRPRKFWVSVEERSQGDWSLIYSSLWGLRDDMSEPKMAEIRSGEKRVVGWKPAAHPLFIDRNKRSSSREYRLVLHSVENEHESTGEKVESEVVQIRPGI